MDDVENSAETEAAPQQTSQEPSQQSQEDRQDRNWREMRRRYDDMQRKSQMQEEILKNLLSQNQQNHRDPEEDIHIDDDGYVQGSQVKKLLSKTAADARKAAKEEAEKLMQQRDQSQFLDRLKRQYDDYEDIVNPETLSILEEQDPELASTILDLKDPYKIGLQSYKYIKSQGIAKNAPSSRRAKEIDRKIEANSKTVQTPQAFDKRPMAQAFQMSDQEKKSLYREMMGYASQVGSSY